MIIEDGRSGMSARVTGEGHLSVRGAVESVEAHHAVEHGATFMTGNGAVTMDGSDNLVFVFQNQSQEDLAFMYGLYASTNSSAGTLVTLEIGTGVPTAGHTAGVIRSTNLAKNVAAKAGSWYGNAMTASAGNILTNGYIAQGYTALELGGILILGYLDTIGFKVQGENAKMATVGLRFWHHSMDE